MTRDARLEVFGTIEQAIEDLRNGKVVIVADDRDRENEGDFVCAAQLCTPEAINFMAQHGRGLICLALTPERCDQLGLPQMTEQSTEELGTAFTVSIDADRRFGVTTGISAADRARTVQVALNPETTPADLRTQAEFVGDFVKFVQEAKRAGKTVDQVVSEWKTPAKYAGYASPQANRVRADAQVIWDETR